MSQHRRDKWDRRAAQFFGLPNKRRGETPSKSEYEARFKPVEFHKAVIRVAKREAVKAYKRGK